MSVRGPRPARRAAAAGAVGETAAGAVGETAGSTAGEAIGGPLDEAGGEAVDQAAGEAVGGPGERPARGERRTRVPPLAQWRLLERLRGPQDPGRRLLLLVTVWTLAGANLLLSTVTEQASALYFAVYPLLWAVHRTRATGIMSTVVFSAGMAAAMTIRTGQWAEALTIGGVSCLFSTAIGLWIWRLYEISEALKESLAAEQAALRELARAQAELAAAEHAAGAALERERWAREVHDTLAQGFVSVITLSQAARSELAAGAPRAVGSRLDQLEAVARENLAEARALVDGDRPSPLLDDGLAAALDRLVETQRRRGLDASLRAELPEGLPSSMQVVVLRTVQEALSNVARHARASSVSVAVAAEDGELVVAVQDDGVGAHASPEGTGLTGMRTRVESLGGTLTVDPVHAPDVHGRTGAILEARMPL